MPGSRVFPAPSTIRAPAGGAPVPIEAILPPDMTTVWPSTGGLPSPSMTRTLVIATTGASTATN